MKIYFTKLGKQITVSGAFLTQYVHVPGAARTLFAIFPDSSFIYTKIILDAEGRTYLFDLDFNSGDQNPYTVDAFFYGNASHFINHSCDPNLSIFNVWIDCLDPELPMICFFARRDIDKGEQITFDYSQETTQNYSKNFWPAKFTGWPKEIGPFSIG